EPRLVDDFVRHLVWELEAYNRTRVPAARMRLRLAVDHGPVELAANGFAGATVVAVSRLLTSAHLYEALRDHEQADLVLLLSDHVYRSTVGSGHTTLSPADFREVAVQVKEYRSIAWLRVPGYTVQAAAAPAAEDPAAEDPAADPAADAPAGEVPAADAEPAAPASDRPHGPAADEDARAVKAARSAAAAKATRAAGAAQHHYEAAQLNVNHFAGRVDLRGGTVGFGGSDG
ncbi:MAG TPA: hypothetical protein VGL02_30185, partial [Streptomyces sp.]